jgi:hypothetical protein
MNTAEKDSRGGSVEEIKAPLLLLERANEFIQAVESELASWHARPLTTQSSAEIERIERQIQMLRGLLQSAADLLHEDICTGPGKSIRVYYHLYAFCVLQRTTEIQS